MDKDYQISRKFSNVEAREKTTRKSNLEEIGYTEKRKCPKKTIVNSFGEIREDIAFIKQEQDAIQRNIQRIATEAIMS